MALIEDAERRGVLRAGMTLVEATGGNTGIGLAFAAAIRGYRLILTMPGTMSKERVALLRHLGADVVLIPGILMGDSAPAAPSAGSARHSRSADPACAWSPWSPRGAAALSGGPAGSHRIPGIGAGFVPEILNRSILDEVIAVTDEDAFRCTRRLARKEGILAGVSSGAALHAALAVASREEAAGRTIVVLLPDTGERYVTTELFTARDSQAE